MREKDHPGWGLAASVCVLAGLSALSLGQARSARSISTPGYFKDLGARGPSGTFRGYSFGVGSLHTPSGSGGSVGNVLQSSIGSQSSFSLRPSSSGSGSSGMFGQPVVPAPSIMGGKLYNPSGGLKGFADVSAQVPGRSPIPSGSPMMAASAYLNAIQMPTGGLRRAQQGQAVTSLVPADAGLYKTYMERGENAMHAGNFVEAFAMFQMANDIEVKDPDSLVSMAHASFALARLSYYRSAYYLQKAIRYLPELPLVPLKPEGFFPNRETLAQKVGLLEDHVEASPRDAAGQLILAYFRWFQGQHAEARDALARARSAATDRDMVEAIETFWDGMVASGKVSGELLRSGQAQSTE